MNGRYGKMVELWNYQQTFWHDPARTGGYLFYDAQQSGNDGGAFGLEMCGTASLGTGSYWDFDRWGLGYEFGRL